MFWSTNSCRLVNHLLLHGLQADPTIWTEITSTIQDIIPLKTYFQEPFFWLTGLYPPSDGIHSQAYQVSFSSGPLPSYQAVDLLVADHFHHPNPVKRWTAIWAIWYAHQEYCC